PKRKRWQFGAGGNSLDEAVPVVDTARLLVTEGGLGSILRRELATDLNRVSEGRHPRAVGLRKRIDGQIVQAGDNEEPLARLRIPKVVRGDEAVTAARDMHCSADIIPKAGETLLDDAPGSALIVALKVAHVFQHNIRRLVSLENLQNLVEERTPRL